MKLRWAVYALLYCSITLAGQQALNFRLAVLASRNEPVRLGIDMLEESHFAALHPSKGSSPRSIGVLTNQTGVDSQGRRTIDVLANVPGISLDAIFSPEHGVTGTLDTTDIQNTRDAATGAAVYSVYGAKDAARHPSPAIIKRLDAIVIDLADAGARFYTYQTTIGYFLEAAAKANIDIILLDRPNPITGSLVQGPVSDATQSFTNYFPEPVRHAMTLGELAQMFNAERHLGARLTVVAMKGWQRADWFDSTGLEWINPSPNERNLTEATLYPGVALIEGTDISVGRGTDTPFELIGAPWINGKQLATYLNAREIPGIRFIPVSFTPSSANFAGQLCHGVNLVVVDRNVLDTPELGIELASALHKIYPDDFTLVRMAPLLANTAVLTGLTAGKDPRRIEQDWQESLQKFLHLRQKYLLY